MSSVTRLSRWCTCFLAFAGVRVAFADFVGLETIDRTDLTIVCHDIQQPEITYKVDVCNVHAVFDDPADRLLSVGFGDISTTALQGFFQHPLGGDKSPNCALYPSSPDLRCDSFITLGRMCSNGALDTTAFDPDFISAAFNSTCGLCQFNGLCVSGIGPCDEDECVAGFCDVTGGACPNGDVDCLGPGECTGGSDSCKPDSCLQNDCIGGFCAITGGFCFLPVIPCPVVMKLSHRRSGERTGDLVNPGVLLTTHRSGYSLVYEFPTLLEPQRRGNTPVFIDRRSRKETAQSGPRPGCSGRRRAQYVKSEGGNHE